MPHHNLHRLGPVPARRPDGRIDLIGVGEVGDGEMKMAIVDGTDQVLVINQAGEFTAVQGSALEYFELNKGFLTNGTLTCALHLSRFGGRTASRSTRRGGAARRVPGGDRGRPGPHRVPDGPLEIGEG